MIPLHVHSNYSLLQSAVTIENLVSRAKEYNLPSLALTDTNGMYGLVSFAKKCIETGIKPIFGAYVDDPYDGKINCVVLAKNNDGYSELCKLITLRKLNEDFSLRTLLNQNFNNLFIISSSIDLLKNLDREDVYAELISVKSEKKHNRNLYEFAKSNNIKPIVTNPIYFLNKEDHLIHKILTAIRLNKNLDNLTNDEVVNEEYFFKDPNTIYESWKSLPEVFQNLEAIASNCNVDLKIGEYKFPHFTLSSTETSSSFLRSIAYEGLSRRYQPMFDKATERLEYELSVIEELNFTDYFLVVWDIVKEAKRRGMMTIGRGSAAE